jgi:hypothetical protein
VEPSEHDELLRMLVRIAAHQETINADLREFNRQQVAINADVQTTLARLETLIARLIPTAENGREA